MFTNRPGCTIYEKTVQNRAPTYIRHEVGAVYWEETLIEGDGKDRSPRNDVLINIPEASSNYMPKTDDRICPEIIPDLTPPSGALTIYSVSDRRYGSSRVRHIELKAR